MTSLLAKDVMSSGTMPARTAVVADATPPAAQQTIGADAQTVSLTLFMLVVTHIMETDRSCPEAHCVGLWCLQC